MAKNVKDILCSVLKTAEFALKMDEPALLGNESLLIVNVHLIEYQQLASYLQGN